MTIHFQFDSLTGLDEQFDVIKVECQDAMAGRFAEIARENIGFTGTDRPHEWQKLSPKYAKRVKRSDATLFVTGDLYNSIQTVTGNYDFSECYSDSDYALAHQEGVPDHNLPSRPFFPVFENGDLTPMTEEQVIEAAQNRLEAILT